MYAERTYRREIGGKVFYSRENTTEQLQAEIGKINKAITSIRQILATQDAPRLENRIKQMERRRANIQAELDQRAAK